MNIDTPPTVSFPGKLLSCNRAVNLIRVFEKVFYSLQQDRVRLEQQVKDQEAMLNLLKQQQNQQQPHQLQSQHIPLHANVATGIPPQGTFVSYVPYPMSGGFQPVPTMPGIAPAQAIYTVPQVYGAIPPPVGFQQK